jgi:UDP-N-acetylmuramoylalanine--D-glutamate ligase
LIHHILKQVYKDTDKTIFLGGNVRGVSTLPFLDDAKKGDIAVLELDSWQLQGFGEAKISPHISVFTTFMDDHLNYYKNDRELYFNDKANIYLNQKENDVLVVGEDIQDRFIDHGGNIKNRLIIAKRENVPEDWKIQIPGEHNKLNIACAVGALRALGINEEEIKIGVESYSGVEGRLQKIKDVILQDQSGVVEIWNDNNATTPDATIAALKALAPKPVVLIMGGADKGIDMTELLKIVQGATKKIILIPGTGTDRLLREYEVKGRDIEEVETLSEAVEVAVASATEGDVILFSPAFASFGLFKNEYDRNDQFVELIKAL